MRSPSRLAAVAVLAASILILSGCMPPEPVIGPPPEVTTSPLFASDEEALAAATAAYEAYLQMSDLIAQEGGVDPERLAPFVTEEWLEKEIKAFKGLVESGRYQEGATSFGSVELQQYEASNVGVYFCLDTSRTKFISGDGVDQTPQVRSTLIAVEVPFASLDKRLVIEGIEPWPNASIC